MMKIALYPTYLMVKLAKSHGPAVYLIFIALSLLSIVVFLRVSKACFPTQIYDNCFALGLAPLIPLVIACYAGGYIVSAYLMAYHPLARLRDDSVIARAQATILHLLEWSGHSIPS